MSDNLESLPDIAENRKARKWTRRELFGRLLWDVLKGPLFSWTPRQFWVWRRIVLRLFGARIARHVQIYPSVKIAVPWNLAVGESSAIGDGAIIYSLGPVTLGERVTVSQYAHLCAGSHDYRDPSLPLTKPSIEIGDGAWICAEAFVAPGVSVGARAIVGARAVTTHDVPDDQIVAGNPARMIRMRPPMRGVGTND